MSIDQAMQGRIDIRQLSIRLGDGRTAFEAVQGLDCQIEAGQFVCILGPSGCGKSTLLGALAGHLQTCTGTLSVDGAKVLGPSPQRGMVFQHHTLFPWRTVRDNVALGLQARKVPKAQLARVDEALALVGLSEFAASYPHQLSGGMAQRAALARALVNEPQLLILDEPLGKLDSLTRLSMQAELLKLWQRAGFSVLLVTHDVEEALFLANRVVVFSDRPARTVAELTVDLPYPRYRTQPRFVELRQQALRHLGLGDVT